MSTKGVTIHFETPESDKLLKVQKESQAIGQFLEWLTVEQDVVLARYPERGDHLIPVHDSINNWLARYFQIDLQKVEQEKSALLKGLRAASSARAL